VRVIIKIGDIFSNTSGLEFVITSNDFEKSDQSHKYYNIKFDIFPDGHTEQILHVSDLCKQHGLHRQNVNRCLCGEQKNIKGL